MNQQTHNTGTTTNNTLTCEELLKANHELTLLLDSIDEVLWAVDLKQQRVLQMSAACEKIYGYKPEEFINNTNLWQQVIYTPDLKLIERNQERLEKGEQVTNHYRIVHKDGSIRYVEAKITPGFDEQGQLSQLRGLVRDITKEKSAYRALMESEQTFRQFFENAYEAIIVIDAETGLITDYNRNALQMFKLNGAEILKQTITGLSPVRQPNGSLSEAKVAELITGTAVNARNVAEWVFVNAENQAIPCEMRISDMLMGSKRFLRISIVDISERKQAEHKLLAQQRFYSSLMENINDGIVLIGPTGAFMYQSPSADKIAGFTFDEIKDKTMFELVHPDDLADLSSFFIYIMNTPGVPQTRQFRFLHKQGHYIWIEGTMTNLLHDENIRGFVTNYRDIGERKAAEIKLAAFNEELERKVKERTAELIEANRELEAFNYTVSHDLQAPLRAACGFAKILLSEYKDKLDDEGVHILNVINNSSVRMSQLIRDLLDFAKLSKAEMVKKTVDMENMARIVVDEVRFNTGNTSFKLVLNKLDDAHGDPGLLKQVWINLVSNAVKYSSKQQQPVVEIGCKNINNETVYYIKDNGAGFDMKFAGKLFTVFKRMHNNEEFEGTGVGLATVHRIITRHGGRVWAEATINQGATFYFTLAA